jgi:hypothetical protein
LISAFAAYVIKKHVEVLEQENKNLSRENTQLEAKLTKAEADAKDAKADVESITVIFEDLQQSGLKPEDAARLQRVLGRLRRIQSMQQGFENYRSAARWLEHRKIEWVKESVKQATRKHPTLVTRKSKKKFQQDIEGYLDWIYTSLYVYGHQKAPIKDFVGHPNINSSYPYIAAICSLKDNGDRKELTIEQTICLEKMMDELINKIRIEFKNT